MHQLSKKPLAKIGYDFVPSIHLQDGRDEFTIRDQQFGKGNTFRKLTSSEIESLVKNENVADNWDDIRVSTAFDPNLVRNCHFHGRVRIGALEPYYLEYHELRLPVGLYNSTIISCDIGHHVAIKNVHYLAYYIIGNEVLLFNINEMQTTSHAKFGNGILKQGEKESARTWLEVANENGNRRILPFEGILPADASLWAKFRDDQQMIDSFISMTDQAFDKRRGYYGTVGNQCVIKNTQIIKDVKVGSHAYIKGANKLKNLTIQSSATAASQIGEGVELVNGVMGYGSRAFYGVKAVRFVLGENSTLKYGARLINSLLGDNSTISCCEVLNSLIFPGHEQHHNNSFLVAATVMGQSNIAAAATLGSNHNSRAADGEIVAGRGFWPGLAVSLKHNSKFASFCLLAKGAFPAELNIRLPFALVINNDRENALDIIPAYWWMYNMYALSRNTRKYQVRDQRKFKKQAYESDYLAPDTVEEIFTALQLLEDFTAKAYLNKFPEAPTPADGRLNLGKHLLLHEPEVVDQLVILGEDMENSKRKVRIFKVAKAYEAYRTMLHYYGMKTLLKFSETQEKGSWTELKNALMGSQRTSWFNLGGQLIRTPELRALRQSIRMGKLTSWDDIHQHYAKLQNQYEQDNAAHALATLLELHDQTEKQVDAETWNSWLEQAIEIAQLIARKTKESREKDYHNPYRKITFASEEEMNAVLGPLADNVFILEMEQEAARFAERAATLMSTLTKMD